MILITGCARSGTSLTTQILQAHGCYLGNKASINTLYENTDIRQNILKPFLASVGADPLGQSPLPDTDNLPSQIGLRQNVMKRFEGGPQPWAYKDAKLTLVWPTWAEAFPDARWVIVRRDPEKIIDSCLRTGFMRKHGNRAGWASWVHEHEKRFVQMKKSLKCIEIWPAQYISDPRVFEPVCKYLGLKFNPEHIVNNIRHRLWHG